MATAPTTVKAPTIFGTIKNFFTAAVPQAGEGVNQVLKAVAINANSAVNLSIVGNTETKIMAVDSLKEFNQACTDAGMTPAEVNALLKGYDF